MQTGKIHTRPQMAHIRRITYLLFNLCVTLCYFVVRQIARMAIIALRLTLFGTLAYWHIGILASCTKADIMYRQVVPGEGMIHIRPDMSVYTLPAQQYYFYNQDGTTPCISLTCDGHGNFSGVLPEGIYYVIASNTSATNAAYNGMDSHETATVEAVNLLNMASSRQTNRTGKEDESTAKLSVRNEKGLLGKVYRVTLEDLHVSAGDTMTLTPTPYLLTRTVTLSFTLDSELQDRVTGLSGILCGVYPSVLLFTGNTTEDEVKRSPNLQVGYEATVSEDHPNLWAASINLFGLHDPKYGENYQNMMTITLAQDGEQLEVKVDLTDELSKAMEQYEGYLPIDIPLHLEIELVWKDVEAVGKVKPWEEGSQGGGESEIPIPT